MRRVAGGVACMFLFVILLAACGPKDEGDVVTDLSSQLQELNSYKSSGTMSLMAGEDAQEYRVDVWYKTPDHYRIALTNEQEDITQIVLKNDEGVFVLTPHLNKSFRFQSDWPTDQGQVYLYQSLVTSVQEDEERQFTVDEESSAYVFDVVANYDNQSMARQRIWLDQKNYTPQKVEVLNANNEIIVLIEFDEFTLDHSFAEDDFDMQRNLESSSIPSLPTMIEQMERAAAQDEDADRDQADAQSIDFGVIEPTYLPEGVHQQSMETIEWGEDTAVMLRYTGDYHFTILETQPEEEAVTAQWGEVVDPIELGYTVGVLTGEEMKTLRWMSDGVEFRLTSSELPKEEMIKVAQSVQGQVGK